MVKKKNIKYIIIFVLPLVIALLISSILTFVRGTAVYSYNIDETYLASVTHITHEIDYKDNPNTNQNIIDINKIYASEFHISGCVDRNCESEQKNPTVKIGNYNLGEIPLRICTFSGKESTTADVTSKIIIFQLDSNYVKNMWNPHIHNIYDDYGNFIKTISHQLDDSTFTINENCAEITNKQLILYERVDCVKDEDCFSPIYLHSGLKCNKDYKCEFYGKQIEVQETPFQFNTPPIVIETTIEKFSFESFLIRFVLIFIGSAIAGTIVYVLFFKKNKK